MNETIVHADSIVVGDIMRIAGNEYRVDALTYAPSARERAAGEADYGYRLQHTSIDAAHIDLYLPTNIPIVVFRQ